jgi:cobyrinic acid a,c-diamide synthase
MCALEGPGRVFEETSIPRLVVAGLHSGTGKTTVTIGLAAALRRRGLAVQPFKVGLDLHDGAYLARVCGRPSRNLDGWILGGEGVRRTLAAGSVEADVALIEGGMGLLDGHGPDAEPVAPGVAAGSTADVALSCGAPILLVLDVSSMRETAAALALGVRLMAPSLRIAGTILNGVVSDHHQSVIEDAIWDKATLPVLGALPRMAEATIPERPLGLAPVEENPRADDSVEHLARAVERHCDVDLILRLMRGVEPVRLTPVRTNGHDMIPGSQLRLAVAFDDAFSAYYPENLELLEAAGAEIVTFSPLDDRQLPAGVDGVYLGGGSLERWVERLAQNAPMAESLRRARGAGIPIYAEGGGTLLAARRVRLADGSVHEMAGLLPFDVEVRHQAAWRDAYRDLSLAGDCLLGPKGTRLRGHEHHAKLVGNDCSWGDAAYTMHDADGQPLGCEGCARPGIVASLVQLHFGQDPAIAPRLVAGMRAARRGAGAATAAEAGV